MQTPQTDRVLEHSLTYALIEIGDAPAVARAAAPSTRARRSVLFARDQIEGAQVPPDDVVPLLDASDKELQDAAWWVAARHPEWGDALARPIRVRLGRADVDADERARLQQRLASFASSIAIQQVLADVVTGNDPARARADALRVMADAMSVSAPPAIRIRELPAAWAAALRRALADPDDTVVQQAVAVTRGMPASAVSTGRLEEALLDVARGPSRGRELRVLALSALPDAAPLTPDLFDLLSSSLQLERSSAARATAADVVGRRRLTREQLRALLPALSSASAIELPRLLAPFGNDSDEELGLAMLDALDRSPARAALRADALRPRLAKYPESVRAAGEKLLASLHVDAASQASRLESLLGALPGGDTARGQRVFNGPRGGCLACHQIGYGGGRIGPDLTRIGQVRGDRDLLESIIYPSVSFARGYEPVVVRTTAGDTATGVQRLDEGDEVVLADVTGKETRISRRTIADIQPGNVSLMPAGFGEMLTQQELADLLAFLRAAR